MQILNTSLEDLDQISELARIVWYARFIGMISKDHIEYMLSLKYTPEKLRADILDSGAIYLKLVERDQLVGFASFRSSDELNLLLLDKLYVHPAQQRKGNGTRLMSQAKKRRRKKDIRESFSPLSLVPTRDVT